MRFAKSTVWLANVAVLGALLLSCRGEIRHDDPITAFTGRVVDSLTGAAIAEAVVFPHDTTWLNDTTLLMDDLLTDSAGQFNTATFGLGNFRLFCLKEGYSTKYKDVTSDQRHPVIDSILFELVPIPK